MLTFLHPSNSIFFQWIMVSLKECNGPMKRNICNGHWNTDFLFRNPKRLRILRCPENKIFQFFTQDIRNVEKNGCYFLKKLVFLKNISVPVPVPYVSLHGPITLLEGHHNPLKKKNEFERRKKFSIFTQSLISHYFSGPYVGCSWWAPARGCPHFSNFWKSPKNEASRSKKLKFNEIKEFWKSCLLRPP